MFIILFGVTGVGKTTIGQLLSQELSWPFYDADDFHSSTNVAKMRQGIPLTDDDRKPWLENLYTLIDSTLQAGKTGVLACSALKEMYRKYLQVDDRVKLVYLKGNFALITERLRKRTGHYMNPVLLQSQFETLEEPHNGELVITVDDKPPEIVAAIRQQLNL